MIDVPAAAIPVTRCAASVSDTRDIEAMVDGAFAPAAIGASGYRVQAAHDLDAVLVAALLEPGVSLVDCPLDYSLTRLLGTDLYARALEEQSAS